MRRWRRTVPAALCVALLTACTVPPLDPTSDPELEPPPAPPPARTNWALSHRVIESYGLQITGHNIGHYEEATYLSLGRDASDFDIPCYVTVSVPGQGGGPESMIGEKVPTHVQGLPGFRNGAGAEAAYAMWQHAGESWTMVHCGLDHQRFVDVVVNALQFRPSSIFLPFGLVALPEGYGLSNISQDLSLGRTEVYVGAVDPAFGTAEPELVISYETGADPLHRPRGRTITVNGRTAMLNDEPTSPGICVLEQQRSVCVSVFAGDTGPYPNRSGEIPTLLGIAESLRFAKDLDARSTWFPAERAFG